LLPAWGKDVHPAAISPAKAAGSQTARRMRDEAFLPAGRLRKPGMPFAALLSRAAPALYAPGIGLSRRSNWFIFASPVFNWSGGRACRFLHFQARPRIDMNMSNRRAQLVRYVDAVSSLDIPAPSIKHIWPTAKSVRRWLVSIRRRIGIDHRF
jgi:hypothetical protein